MKDNVLKNDRNDEEIDFIKKTKWNRKTYPLKLNLTDIQLVRLENLIYQYKKGINRIIEILLKEYFPNYLLRLSEDNIEEGVCPSCQTKKKLRFELSDFEFVRYSELKGKPLYKPILKKGNKVKICEMCSCSHYSLRKFLLPSSKREVPIKEWDFTKDINLGSGSSIYDSCLQKAVETIKSQQEIKKKIDYKINFYRKRILENTIKLNNTHKKDFLNFIESKNLNEKDGLSLLKKFIKRDEISIEKEKKKKAENIVYKNDSIRLYENSYEFIEEEEDFFIKFKDYSRDKCMTLSFYGKDYQKKLAEKFIKSKKAETEIVRKGDDFYLQYIYRKELNVPTPNKSFNAVGIDVNIINLSSYVAINSRGDILKIKFYSGRNMRFKRRRFKEVRKIWQSKTKYVSKGGKGRAWKWYLKKQKSQNERNYVKYIIHNLTTDIVQNIKENFDKPVIVLEELKNIRDRIGKELKITKSSIDKLKKNQQKAIRGDKLLNSELNNWNFDEFQKFLEYKANWLGIPIVKVPAKNTSICCNKCGECDKSNYEDYHKVKFKCKKCGYECNADFNASLNIARSFYKNLETN